MDAKDMEILGVLMIDSRTSYRSIGRTVHLSTNAVKTRVNKLVASGVIQQFQTLVNPTIFGFSKICYLTLRDSKTEETVSRLRLFGELVSETYCVGGISLFGIAVKGEDKIPLLNEALKPALIQSMVMG